MNKKTLMIAVAVIVAIVVIVGACVLLSSGKSSLKKEVVSQENYETILDEVGKKFGESDETYYYTYACIYHTAKAGFTEEYLQSKEAKKIVDNWKENAYCIYPEILNSLNKVSD